VNAVSPGVVDTAWWDAMPADQRSAFFADLTARLPLARIAQPAELAATITLLISSTYVTGQVLVADGGLHLAR